jgi:hypothetical protein
MINHLLDWLHNRLLSLWGNIPAWGAVGYQAMFGEMSGITALGATLAAWLTWLSIREKLTRRRDLALVQEVFLAADENQNEPLKAWAADMMARMRTRPAKLD